MNPSPVVTKTEILAAFASLPVNSMEPVCKHGYIERMAQAGAPLPVPNHASYIDRRIVRGKFRFPGIRLFFQILDKRRPPCSANAFEEGLRLKHPEK
jgi:hypothetical protein